MVKKNERNYDMNYKHLSISALLLAAALMFSCNDSTPPISDQTEDTSVETTQAVTEPVYKYAPQNSDYGGAEFRILNYDNEKDNGWTGIPDDIFTEEDTSDILSEAVYTRNRNVEELLHITITGEKYDGQTMVDLINKTTMSDSDEFDAAFPRLYNMAGLVTRQLLCNLYDTGIDFADPWWDQNSVNAFDLSGVLFGAISDITFYDKISTYVTFFNTKLIASHGLEDPYDLLENGTWTLEKLLEMGESVSKDMDGNGTYDKEDAYGLGFAVDAAYVLLNAANETIIQKNPDGIPEYHLTDEHVISTMQRIYELMFDTRRFFNRSTYNMSVQDAINMFVEDRVLFLIRPIQSLFMMRDMEADFGITTVPKMDETQTTVGSSVNPYAGTVMVLPTVVKDKARAADVLQTLACESYYTVKEPLYDLVLGTKLTRDERSAEMLDVAFENRVYDIGLIFDFGGLSDKILYNKSTEIASQFEAWEKSVNKKIDALNEQIEAVKES